jgi:hypothetical protein
MAKPAGTVRQQYDALKAALGTLGFVRPGSIARRFVRCGKLGCRCMADPPTLHGPYYDWTYKLRGKSLAMRLTETQAKQCDEWLRNHRQLRRIVNKMRLLSLKETNRLLQALANADTKSGR